MGGSGAQGSIGEEMTHVHVHRDRLHVHVHDEPPKFEEAKHPRGRGEKGGQFVKKGEESGEGEFAKENKSLGKIFEQRGWSHRGGGKYSHGSGETGHVSEGHWRVGSAESNPSHNKWKREQQLHIELTTAEKRSHFGSDLSGPSRGRPVHTEMQSPITNDERVAVGRYGENWWPPINAILRRGGGENPPWRMSSSDPFEPMFSTREFNQYKKAIAAISSSISKSITTAPSVVYRGVGDFEANKWPVGEVISSAGFVSTSSDPAVADKFSKFDGGNPNNVRRDNPAILEISLPAGVPALDMGRFLTGRDREAEVLLDHGVHLRVDSVDASTGRVKLSVVPPTQDSTRTWL